MIPLLWNPTLPQGSRLDSRLPARALTGATRDRGTGSGMVRVECARDQPLRMDDTVHRGVISHRAHLH